MWPFLSYLSFCNKLGYVVTNKAKMCTITMVRFPYDRDHYNTPGGWSTIALLIPLKKTPIDLKPIWDSPSVCTCLP